MPEENSLTMRARTEMAAFDALPAPVRAALREACYNWPAHELAGCCGDDLPAAKVTQTVDLIKRHDTALLERRNQEKTATRN